MNHHTFCVAVPLAVLVDGVVLPSPLHHLDLGSLLCCANDHVADVCRGDGCEELRGSNRNSMNQIAPLPN